MTREDLGLAHQELSADLAGDLEALALVEGLAGMLESLAAKVRCGIAYEETTMWLGAPPAPGQRLALANWLEMNSREQRATVALAWAIRADLVDDDDDDDQPEREAHHLDHHAARGLDQ